MGLIIIALILAIIPALIAQKKGRHFLTWYIYGFFLFIVALIHVLVIEKEETTNDNLKKCPACGEFIRREAILCRYCSTKFIVTPIENSQNNLKENIQ